MSWKGLSETPLRYISRYKGDSVSRYRRYPSIERLVRECWNLSGKALSWIPLWENRG